MIISDNTILTFGKHKGSKAKDVKICGIFDYRYLQWLHFNTNHKLDKDLLEKINVEIDKDIKKYQKDFEEGKYSNRNFQTHTDDPYYIPGEQGW